MSTHVMVPMAEVEGRKANPANKQVHATIEVAADPNDPEGLVLSTTSDQISIEDGETIRLQPASSLDQPAAYHLTFKAGAGVGSFGSIDIPAAEISLSGNKEKSTAFIPVHRVTEKLFRMTFTNNVPKDPGVSTSVNFFINWTTAGEPAASSRVRQHTDPTILLDPPKS